MLFRHVSTGFDKLNQLLDNQSKPGFAGFDWSLSLSKRGRKNTALLNQLINYPNETPP
jgi:hypothetical protein